MVKLEETKTKQRLSCTECFAVIELLAEGAGRGVDLKLLEELARVHLSQCAHCQDALLEQLSRLEKIAK
jgi:cytidine deaminase